MQRNKVRAIFTLTNTYKQRILPALEPAGVQGRFLAGLQHEARRTATSGVGTSTSTSCSLRHKDASKQRQRVKTAQPGHQAASGAPQHTRISN